MELHEITDLDGRMFIGEEVMIGKENLFLVDWFEERGANDSEYDTPEPSDPWEEVESRSDENMRHSRTGSSCYCPRLSA